MSSNNRVGLDNVRWLVWLFLGWMYWLRNGHAPQPQRTPCTLQPPKNNPVRLPRRVPRLPTTSGDDNRRPLIGIPRPNGPQHHRSPSGLPETFPKRDSDVPNAHGPSRAS